MKTLIAALIIMLIAASACAAPEAAPTTSTTTSLSVSPVPPETTPLPVATSPPEHVTSASQGGVLRTWNMSPLWIDPGVPTAGRPVYVGANIYIDDIPLSHIVTELSVNGVVVDSKQLTFWYDDPLPFSLSFTPDKPGVYEVFIRANMLENEEYVKSTGEDLSLYSAAVLTVTG